MKISGRKPVQKSAPIDSLSAASKPDTAEKVEDSAPAQSGDNISLSGASKQIQSAQSAIQGLPDVRLERVTEIKNALDDGNYHVESEVIAKKMVNESLGESLRRK